MSKDVLGTIGNTYIEAQNALVGRVAFLVHLCKLRNVHYIIEQPSSSVMFNHPAMVAALADATHVSLPLGAFGLESTKPLVLVGSAPYLHQMSAAPCYM